MATLIKIGRVGCGPCAEMDVILNELAEELYERGIEVVHESITDTPDLVETYGLKGVPTMIFFDDGEIKWEHVGRLSESELREKLTL